MVSGGLLEPSSVPGTYKDLINGYFITWRGTEFQEFWGGGGQ